jgi:hypothetical protein
MLFRFKSSQGVGGGGEIMDWGWWRGSNIATGSVGRGGGGSIPQASQPLNHPTLPLPTTMSRFPYKPYPTPSLTPFPPFPSQFI